MRVVHFIASGEDVLPLLHIIAEQILAVQRNWRSDTGGVEDVRNRVMRLIGDPDVRDREDPVRMLRAVRFAAKLGFSIERESEAPLNELGELLNNVPPARLFDETIKLFLAGHAAETYRLLQKYDLFRYMFPATAEALRSEDGEQARRMLDAAMANTDVRVAEERPVTVMFLLAVFMWEPIRRRALALVADKDMRYDQALFAACDQLMRAQQDHVTVPKRIMYPIRDRVDMQDRFAARSGNRPARLARHPRFRAAYDLLLLRAASGEVDQELAQWWTDYQESGAAPVPDKDAGGTPGRRRGRRRRPRRRTQNSGGQ